MKKFILLIALSVLFYSVPGYTAARKDPGKWEMQKGKGAVVHRRVGGRCAEEKAASEAREVRMEAEREAASGVAVSLTPAEEMRPDAGDLFERRMTTRMEGLMEEVRSSPDGGGVIRVDLPEDVLLWDSAALAKKLARENDPHYGKPKAKSATGRMYRAGQVITREAELKKHIDEIQAAEGVSGKAPKTTKKEKLSGAEKTSLLKATIAEIEAADKAEAEAALEREVAARKEAKKERKAAARKEAKKERKAARERANGNDEPVEAAADQKAPQQAAADQEAPARKEQAPMAAGKKGANGEKLIAAARQVAIEANNDEPVEAATVALAAQPVPIALPSEELEIRIAECKALPSEELKEIVKNHKARYEERKAAAAIRKAKPPAPAEVEAADPSP